MADTLKLNMLSPERRILDSQTVEYVTLPGSEGEIQILPGHVPMIGTLETGVYSYRTSSGNAGAGVISSGFFEVLNDELNVLAETLELKSEIDVNRARAAQQKAESALMDADLDEHKFKKYQLKLQRAVIRQQFVDKE